MVEHPELEILLKSRRTSLDILAEALVDEHFAPAYRFAMALLNDPSAAQAAAKQGLAMGLAAAKQYHAAKGVRLWLYPLVLNAIHAVRSQRHSDHNRPPAEFTGCIGR